VSLKWHDYLHCTERVDELFPDASFPGDDLRCASGDQGACARNTNTLRAAGYFGCLVDNLDVMACDLLEEFHEQQRKNTEQCEVHGD